MKNVKLLFLMFIVLVPHACASEKDSDWIRLMKRCGRRKCETPDG